MCWFVLGRHCVCILCHEEGTIIIGSDSEMEKNKNTTQKHHEMQYFVRVLLVTEARHVQNKIY